VQERGQPRQRLFPATAHAQQQSIATGLLDDARNAGDVFDGLFEEHDVHGGQTAVVLLQLCLQAGLQLLEGGDRDLGVLAHLHLSHEGGEDESGQVALFVGDALEFVLGEQV